MRWEWGSIWAIVLSSVRYLPCWFWARDTDGPILRTLRLTECSKHTNFHSWDTLSDKGPPSVHRRFCYQQCTTRCSRTPDLLHAAPSGCGREFCAWPESSMLMSCRTLVTLGQGLENVQLARRSSSIA